AGAVQGRQDDHRGSGRHALPSASRGEEACSGPERAAVMSDYIRRHPLFAAVAAFIMLFVVLSSFPIVPETKQAVVVRFGKPVRILNRYEPGRPIGAAGAGISWRLPFAEQLVWIDKRVQDVDMQRQPVLSTDQRRLPVHAFR